MTLKKVYKSLHLQEAEIANLFSSEPLASDCQNYCAQIFQILRPPDSENFMIFVMPLLRGYDDFRLDTSGEVVDFF